MPVNSAPSTDEFEANLGLLSETLFQQNKAAQMIVLKEIYKCQTCQPWSFWPFISAVSSPCLSCQLPAPWAVSIPRAGTAAQCLGQTAQ